MLIKLAICLFLATQIHAGVIRDDNNVDSNSTNIDDVSVPDQLTYFDTDKLMEKLSAYNITCSDIKPLRSNYFSQLITRLMIPSMISKGVLIIGRTEFRAALNFGPLPLIKSHNKTFPNEEEFASAPTLEDYYNLKETRSNPFFSLDSFYNSYLVDSNMPPAIAFLDKTFPSIRIIFRRKIQEVLRSNEGKMNREEIDIWTSGLEYVHSKIAQTIYGKAIKLECED